MAESVDSIPNQRRFPLIARIYGALILIDGVVTLATSAWSGIQGFLAFTEGRLGGGTFGLTAVLVALQAVVYFLNAAYLIVFGVALIRSQRRDAARWAYRLIPLTVAAGMLSLALSGLGVNLLEPLIQLAIVIALSITADPALAQERALHRSLQRMDARDDYEAALSKGMAGRDMSGKGYIQLDFFNVFWLFVVGCVFGLVIETIYHFIVYGEYQDRAGLLWGPFSPIYGCGAVILTACLNRLWRSHWLLIFCASAVIGGSFEYFTSWFMEVAFGITAWDYTGQWLSIDGRTSGKYMFFWGLLGLVWIKVLLPWLLRLIQCIPWKIRYSLTAVCLVLMVIDVAMTLMALDAWYARMAGIDTDSPAVQFFSAHFGDDYMANRFQTMSLDPGKAGRI